MKTYGFTGADVLASKLAKPELVTLSGVAQILGRSYSHAHTLAVSDVTFPAPASIERRTQGVTRRYRAQDVARWGHAHGLICSPEAPQTSPPVAKPCSSTTRLVLVAELLGVSVARLEAASILLADTSS
jgi:hypothetical protein